MLYLYDDSHTLVTAKLAIAANESAWHNKLWPTIEFAKSIDCFAPKTQRLYGKGACFTCKHSSSPGNVFFDVDVDFGLTESINDTRVTKDNDKIVLVDWRVGYQYCMAAKHSAHSDIMERRVFIDSPVRDKEDSVMYLEQALNYLDSYGHSPNSRVVCFPPCRVTQRPDDMISLSFQTYGESVGWNEWMNGGLVFFKREDKHFEGWSVHT